MILFIHGFGSCGWGEKSLALRHHFGVGRVLAPDLPFHPQAVVEQLDIDLTSEGRVYDNLGPGALLTPDGRSIVFIEEITVPSASTASSPSTRLRIMP